MIKPKGFTLIEIIIVLVIVSILVTIALPQYRRVIERSKRTEAMSILGVMYKAWQVYYDTHSGTKPSEDGSDVDIDLPHFDSGEKYPNTKYWYYLFGDYGGGEVAHAKRITQSEQEKGYVIGITNMGNFTFYNAEFDW